MPEFDPTEILGEWEGYDEEAVTRLPARESAVTLQRLLCKRFHAPKRADRPFYDRWAPDALS